MKAAWQHRTIWPPRAVMINGLCYWTHKSAARLTPHGACALLSLPFFYCHLPNVQKYTLFCLYSLKYLSRLWNCIQIPVINHYFFFFFLLLVPAYKNIFFVIISDITKQILKLVSFSFSVNMLWINVFIYFSSTNERGNTVLVGHNGVKLGHRSSDENDFIRCLCAGTLDGIMITTITRLSMIRFVYLLKMA